MNASTPERHECQRCGSDEWEYVDYSGCSVCRPCEERAKEEPVESRGYPTAQAETGVGRTKGEATGATGRAEG